MYSSALDSSVHIALEMTRQICKLFHLSFNCPPVPASITPCLYVVIAVLLCLQQQFFGTHTLCWRPVAVGTVKRGPCTALVPHCSCGSLLPINGQCTNHHVHSVFSTICNIYYTVFSTFLGVIWASVIWYLSFLTKVLLIYWAIQSCFICPPHLTSVSALPMFFSWEGKCRPGGK